MKFSSIFQIILGVSMAFTSAYADSKPAWMGSDYRNAVEWGFYCIGEADTEDKALALARSSCSSKMCMLFGVEVESKVETSESLKESKVLATTTEKCPNVRISGRTEKKKTVECEDNVCSAYVFQIYPKTQYDLEFKRLNQPAISKVFEKTIVVREGNTTFKDPAACRLALQNYKKMKGESVEQVLSRVAFLKSASKECQELDYRNVDLQSELQGYLISSLIARSISANSILSPIIQEGKNLLDKINRFLAYEESLSKASGEIGNVRKWIETDYDALFSRDNYDSATMEYILVNGKRQKTNPYLDELKTCRVQGSLAVAWPKDMSQDVTACVSSPIHKEKKECGTLSYLMIRARYAGCICTAGAPQVNQECTGILLRHMNESCPGEFTAACFKSMAKEVAETLSVHLPFQFPKSNFKK